MKRAGLRLRTAARQVHLWLGLSLGLLFVVTGLTGSALAFYPEIDAWLDPRVRAVASEARPSSYEAIYQALVTAHSERSRRWRIEVPDRGGPLQARSLSAEDLAGTEFRPVLAWVDPVSLKVVRSDRWGDFLMTWLYDLHYRLLLGKPGAAVMGAVGALGLVLLLAGLITWWPQDQSLRSALAYHRRAGATRKLFDIHKLVGVYTGLVLLLIAATGAMLSLPELVRPAVGSVSPLYQRPPIRSQPHAGVERLPVDAALEIAAKHFPQARLKWIETPDGPTGIYGFRFRQQAEPSRRFPNTTVWTDQFSGRVLAVRDPLAEGAGDTLLNWLQPLHTGQALGLSGRWLAVLVGFAPLGLFVTGLWRWVLTRPARKPRRPSRERP